MEFQHSNFDIMRKKKIAIIGTVGLPANYGGFETLANHLVEELSDDFDFTVYCSSKRYHKENRLTEFKGAKLTYIPLNANGVQSIPYDTLSIIHALFKSDVLLVLGVAGAWIFPLIRLFTTKKIVVSIDGIEWKREKWSFLAKLYLWWAEKIAVRFSHIDLSDNEAIQDYTAVRYKTLSRVIEYGADHTITKTMPIEQHLHDFPFLDKEYAVKVCRIEPENNIHVVLETFRQNPAFNLVLVGNWQNSGYGKNLWENYCHFPNIFLQNPIYEQDKLDIIRSHAKIYIHGHSAGGTNPSLVEAMYLGLPIFSFDVSYNRVTTENNAYYFQDVESLCTLLKEVNEGKLAVCAFQMRSVAQRRYKWSKIAKNYKFTIHDALIQNEKTSPNTALSNLDDSLLRTYKVAHLKYNSLFPSTIIYSN